MFKCTQKLVGYVKKREQMFSLFFCIRKICRQTECYSQAEIIKTDLRKTFLYLKMFVFVVVSSVPLLVACSMKMYFVDNELRSLLPLEIVFINQSTVLGFVTANLVMTVMGSFAAFISLLYGVTFLYAIRMYSLQVILIGQDFKDLDDMWAKGSRVPLICKHTFLRNICKKHQDVKK